MLFMFRGKPFQIGLWNFGLCILKIGTETAKLQLSSSKSFIYVGAIQIYGLRDLTLLHQDQND